MSKTNQDKNINTSEDKKEIESSKSQMFAPGRSFSITALVLSLLGLTNKLSQKLFFSYFLEIEKGYLENKYKSSNTRVIFDTTFVDIICKFANIFAIISIVCAIIGTIVFFVKKSETPKKNSAIVFSIISVILSVVVLVI